MKIPVEIKGGGYDGVERAIEFPDDPRFEEMESIGFPFPDGRTANFPAISVSRKKIILDGERLRWEMRLKEIPIFFQGGELAGQTGTYKAEQEVDIYAIKGGSLNFVIDGVKKKFRIIDVSPSGLLLDGNPEQLECPKS